METHQQKETRNMVTTTKNKLRDIRRSRGLPIMGLAVMAGTSTSTLIAIERWNYRPGPELRERIADALKVTPSDIWSELSEVEQEEEAMR
jgi:DNA-binding XRE family transcriptional regulator